MILARLCAPLTGRAEGLPDRLRALGYDAPQGVDPHTGAPRRYVRPPVVAVPAGPFLMGSDPGRDPKADRDELPQHVVTLGAFCIARHPVTVAEYACFLLATGHRQPPELNWLTWETQLATRRDYPVVNVSWRDAAAYAGWLAAVSGAPYRLPTEAEWEKAARGTDGRLYPWGDEPVEANARVAERGYLRALAPVGVHPAGASPYGVHDMAGNVLEWTTTRYRRYPYRPDDGREVNAADKSISGEVWRAPTVMRGGSWDNTLWFGRAACRCAGKGDEWAGERGFRLILG